MVEARAGAGVDPGRGGNGAAGLSGGRSRGWAPEEDRRGSSGGRLGAGSRGSRAALCAAVAEEVAGGSGGEADKGPARAGEEPALRGSKERPTSGSGGQGRWWPALQQWGADAAEGRLGLREASSGQIWR